MTGQPKDPTAPMGNARLGERVRRLRQAAGLTRSELAALTGLTAPILRNLEQGMSAAPSTWQAHLKHQSMLDLQELAKKSGVSLGIECRPGSSQGERTVAEAITSYLDFLHDRGLHDSTIVNIARVLLSVFRTALSEPLRDLNPERARGIAEDLRSRVSAHTGRPLMQRTCKAYLERTRAFLDWCAQKSWLPANPLRPDSATPSAKKQQEPSHGNR